LTNSWDILCRELKAHGITVLSETVCSCKENGKEVKMSLSSKIHQLRQKHFKNSKLIKQLLFEVSKILNSQNENNKVLDYRIENIFISSVSDLLNFLKLLSIVDKNYENFISKYKINSLVRGLLDKDYNEIESECVSNFINYKISLDWAFRKNCKIEYIASLLMFLRLGKAKIDKIIIKEARGVQGPWSNLDLPMEERVFAWDEVAGDTYGREKDKRNQQRYLMGLDTYHDSSHVGEGYYWREMRNEPFSWDNRFTDSPYAQLKPGTWR
jgi:hypothetical protein